MTRPDERRLYYCYCYFGRFINLSLLFHCDIIHTYLFLNPNMITDSINEHRISCSWVQNVPEDVVVFGSQSDPKEWDEDGGIIHVIKEENFLFLEKNENEPCVLNVKLSDPYTQITNISLVSEARLFEIYGKYGEYIKTCKCELLQEANGRNYYGAQTDLLTSQELILKFPGVHSGIWLCGLKILLKTVAPSITGSFDYDLIDDKLKKSNIPITEKAEQFKKFLQDYASSKYTSTTNLDPHTFLKIMEGECMSHLRPVGTASRNISKYLSNFIPNLKPNEKEPSQDIKKNEASGEPLDQERTQNELKEYVDERIQKLEERLEENFKKQLQEMESKQNEKLDTILALLKNSSIG